MICTCICTAQAVPAYLAVPDHEPETEHRYQETVVDNVVVPHHLLLLYIVLTTTTWQKYRILEIVGIPTIFRYTDSGGSPGGTDSLKWETPVSSACGRMLQSRHKSVQGQVTTYRFGNYEKCSCFPITIEFTGARVIECENAR